MKGLKMNMSYEYLKYANELFEMRNHLLSILPHQVTDEGRKEVKEKIREIELDIFDRLNMNYLKSYLERKKNEDIHR